MIPAEHPCLSAQAHFRYGRIHLPVAPRCNIRCGYCARSVVCAGHVYRTVGGSADAGAMAAFLSAQQEGVAKAAEAGLTVKINTVVIPGFNTGEIEEIACWAARAGAAVMNLMPLIPQAGFRDNEPPSRALLEALRARARVHIPQFTHCRQCRADAVGVPGEMNCIGCL